MQCPVSLPELKLWQQQSKSTHVRIYRSSLPRSKYPVQDCRYPMRHSDIAAPAPSAPFPNAY